MFQRLLKGCGLLAVGTVQDSRRSMATDGAYTLAKEDGHMVTIAMGIGLSGRSSALMAVLLLTLPAMSRAQQVAIVEYLVPTANSLPLQIAAGSDGALWFTEEDGNKIGRITTSGVMTEYRVPTRNSGPFGITAGPDGALWFVENNSYQIGRITTAGAITEYPIPTPDANGGDIAAGPDGALWFNEWDANNIGRVTTAGLFTEYPVPTPDCGVGVPTPGPDGAVWFMEYLANNVARVTTTGAFTEYPIPTPGSGSGQITLGPDGALWFPEQNANKIGRVTTAGAITEYLVPTPNSQPVWVTDGSDGALWFTEYGGNNIGRVTTAGLFTEYPVPTPGAALYGIVQGPDGALWFTEPSANRIGQAITVTANLTVNPASGFLRTNLTFTGSSFAPNESVTIYTKGIGSATLATATADSSGSFTTTALEPKLPYGSTNFLATGQTSGRIGAAPFSVTPRLIMTPNSGTPGSTIAAEGFGFGGGEVVQFYWGNPRQLLGTATANENGTFGGKTALTITIPAGAPTGMNAVFGRGETTHAIGSGLVTVQ